MSSQSKDWLVRLKTGGITGPYTKHELFLALKDAVFSESDEIAKSGESVWISATKLGNHDMDEVTLTSTRLTTTRSFTDSEELTPTPDMHSQSNEELTPTPTASQTTERETESYPDEEEPRSRLLPLFIFTCLIVLTYFSLRFVVTTPDKKEAPLLATTIAEGETPFTREIYALIRSGETVSALKKLYDYHISKDKKESLDYLIPYAALLIIDGESIARARGFLEQILQSQTSSLQLKAQAHHWQGYLILSQNEGDLGESHFLESLQLNPKDSKARFNLARAYLKQEKYSQALDYFQLAELEAPDLWLVHIYKGRTKVSLGQIEEARQSFRTAIQLAPDRWMSYIYYSLYLLGVKSYDEAREMMRTMITKDPSYEGHTPPPFGYFQEKVVLSDYLNSYLHVMEKASIEEKEIGKIYIQHILSGVSNDEIKRLDTIATKGSLTAKILALKTLLDKNRSPEELKFALRRLPENLIPFGPYGYVVRGEARMRLGQYQEAEEDFAQALKLEPRSAIAHWEFAGLLHKKGKQDEAMKEIQTLISFHPDYIPAIVSLRHSAE